MCNVLIATPNPELKECLIEVLNKFFANVFILPHANSGCDAYGIAEMTQPEIFILDLDLAKQNAFYYQEKIVELHPNMRTILIDHEENCKNAQRGIRMGAIDYLVQPLDEKEVLSSIHRAIISLNQVSLLNHRHEAAEPTQNEMILPMLQYIHKNFQSELNLDILSDFMHLNKNYLSQLFKKEVGLSFVAYLNKYRVEQAKLLLRTTNEALAEIAVQVGYSDPTYFSRIFKKLTNLSPNQYRQTYIGDFRPREVQLS